MSTNISSNFALVCDLAFFGDAGKLSIIGIFKNINGKALPLQHPQMFVVSSILIKGSGNYKKVIKLVRTRDGAEIISPLEFNLAVKGESEAEFGVLGQLTNLKFDEAGLYEIQIFVNSELIKKLPLTITVKPS